MFWQARRGFISGRAAFDPAAAAPSPGPFHILREDGTFLLREDGAKFIREDAVNYILREDGTYLLREDGFRFIREDADILTDGSGNRLTGDGAPLTAD